MKRAAIGMLALLGPRNDALKPKILETNATFFRCFLKGQSRCIALIEVDGHGIHGAVHILACINQHIADDILCDIEQELSCSQNPVYDMFAAFSFAIIISFQQDMPP